MGWVRFCAYLAPPSDATVLVSAVESLDERILNLLIFVPYWHCGDVDWFGYRRSSIRPSRCCRLLESGYSTSHLVILNHDPRVVGCVMRPREDVVRSSDLAFGRERQSGM